MNATKLVLGPLVLGLFVVAGMAGCVGTASAHGTLYVKDAPNDNVKQVFVTFSKAEVSTEANASWITVFQGNKTIELAHLNASTAKEQLADFKIPPGDYHELRIVVQGVRVVYQNGTSRTLNVTGGVVTLAEDFSVKAGQDFALLVDFDLNEGIDLGRYSFTPRVKNVQSSLHDSDHDGQNDVQDGDDDNDGVDDAHDKDMDGDGRSDKPQQHNDDHEDVNDGQHGDGEHEGRGHSDQSPSGTSRGPHGNETSDHEG
jgi:hypothetical protein